MIQRYQLLALVLLALGAGLAGGLLAGGAPDPVSAVPEAQRMYGSGIHAWLRSSTRVPLVADQRGSGSAFLVLAANTPAVRVLGNADTVFQSGGAAVFDGAVVVPRGSFAINGTAAAVTGFSTATASATPTPTNTPTPTITPSPTP